MELTSRLGQKSIRLRRLRLEDCRFSRAHVIRSPSRSSSSRKFCAADPYRDVRPLVKPSGMLLVCDHFVGEEGMTDSELFMSPKEHETAIREGGFSAVELLMLKGGLVLFSRPRLKLTHYLERRECGSVRVAFAVTLGSIR